MRRIIQISLLFLLTTSSGFAQQIFDIDVENSESKTDIADHICRWAKFLVTDDRIVIVDYENKRVLFYEKGPTLPDSQILKVVGLLGQEQGNQPYNQVNHNRLSVEFAGSFILYQ